MPTSKSTLLDYQTVPTERDKDIISLSDSGNCVSQEMIPWASIFVNRGGSSTGYTLGAAEIESTGKSFDFLICNSRVSGRGGN